MQAHRVHPSLSQKHRRVVSLMVLLTDHERSGVGIRFGRCLLSRVLGVADQCLLVRCGDERAGLRGCEDRR